MHKSIVLALPFKNSTMVQNPNQLCPSMHSKKKTFDTISFEDAKEQRLKKTLQILIKKVSESRKSPSWVALIGKERRKNIKQIIQTLKSTRGIIPYSAEQFQSFKNALEEHGQEEDMEVVAEPETTSDAQTIDFQELGFDFGSGFGNYCGNSKFLDLEKELECGDLRGCKNRGFDDSRYKLDDLMQLSSVEEVLDEFSKEKLC